MTTLTDLLKQPWIPSHATPLTGLDTALTNLLHSKQPSDDPRHLWLAALTSHQWGRGHACLDLNILHTHAAALLGWSDEQTALLPANLTQAAHTLPWTQGDASPLVLSPDGARLYLRRAWLAEQSIRTSIQARLATACEIPADLQQRLDRLFPKTENNAPDMQRLACEVAAKNAITLITGGPGRARPPRWCACWPCWWAHPCMICAFTLRPLQAKRQHV